MNVSAVFGRWTTTKAALAVAGALAIGGAVGSALAISPIVSPPIKWAGGAEFNTTVNAGLSNMFIVPAGRNLILTELIVGNTTSTALAFDVFTGTPGACTSGARRLHNIMVPPQNTLSVTLQTGVGFTAGQVVCFVSEGLLAVNGRGFLFTAAPAS